ncbi:MAG: hypothetical protein H7Y32_18005 [Chloroflexales bacterium]|nr:hypothetical protein [Chloroflexales bacterium]
MAIRVLHTELRALPMRTRMPFRYGIATLTALPHLFVRVVAQIDGALATGVAADGLAPKWFTKNPATTPGHDIAEMLDVIEAACGFARDAGDAPTVFALWQQIYAAQQEWGQRRSYPPLLWGFGVSLLERALIDAFCRARGTTFARAVRDDTLGIQLGALHPQLANSAPRTLLPPESRATIVARHTVGLLDPLTDDAIPPDERLDDGLPQSLVACVRAYGLTHFKIKLQGDADHDLARLRQIAALLDAEAPGYAFTLDGNEQFHDVESFRALWAELLCTPDLAAFTRRLLFVEQPLHRDVALNDVTGRALTSWSDCPPMIIDESDGALDSLPLALERGYAGTSHKNCKGVFKGIANACLLAWRQKREPERRFVLSGEDLANVGPLALLQDLAAMATLGIAHVERNGHHYFAGLRMFPPDVQEQVLAQHSDLYRRHERGFATLAIRGGSVALDSVVSAPFGLTFPLAIERFPTPAEAIAQL